MYADSVEKSRSDRQYLARVDAARVEADGAGVQGIPTFILGNLAISGCQRYEVFEQFAERAGAPKRKQESSR